jgi:hypothetical protein
VGIGVGFDIYKFASYIPLTLDIRYYVLKSEITPFVEAAAGHSFGFQSHAEGGLVLNPALGLKVLMSSSAAFNFSIGYRQQQIDLREHTAQSIHVKVGFTF